MTQPMSMSSMKCNHLQIPTCLGWLFGKFVVWHHGLTKLWGPLVTHCCMALNWFVSIHARYSCHHSSLGERRTKNCSFTCVYHSSCDMDSCALANIANFSISNILFITTHGEDVILCVLHYNTIRRLPRTIGWITWWWRPLTLIYILTMSDPHGTKKILAQEPKTST